MTSRPSTVRNSMPVGLLVARIPSERTNSYVASATTVKRRPSDARTTNRSTSRTRLVDTRGQLLSAYDAPHTAIIVEDRLRNSYVRAQQPKRRAGNDR